MLKNKIPELSRPFQELLFGFQGLKSEISLIKIIHAFWLIQFNHLTNLTNKKESSSNFTEKNGIQNI